MAHKTVGLFVIIPNWNGADMIGAALDSLWKQTSPCTIVVVDNGSKDGSLELLRPLATKGKIYLIEHAKNTGFAGGVNSGINYALSQGAEAIALLNNDAVTDKDWLKHLAERLQRDEKAGIVTAKILDITGKRFDSTGDMLTIWGLPWPRGRGEKASSAYDNRTRILGASGGASIYRAAMLQKIGLFDEDFFAYYEDIDISLRARLAGWEIYLEPRAKVFHRIGATSGRVKGFTTKQTLKNLPWVLVKNIPFPIFWKMWPRLTLAYWAFFGAAVARGSGLWALKGVLWATLLLPKKLWQRRAIQAQRRITAAQLDALLVHDLPENATKLRRLRSAWWRLRGRHG